MRRHITVCFLALLAFVPRDGAAQTVPEGEVSNRFAVRIGAPWKLQLFAVDATANYGTAVEPIIKSRFHAELKLTTDTYVLADRQDAVSVLGRVGKEGEIRTVYGIATAQLRGGTWQVEFDPQNDPVAGSGLPRDAFAGRLIVRGSDEETAYLKEVAATAAAAQAQVLAEQAAAAKVARDKLAFEAVLRDDARQIAEKEAVAQAAAARKREDETAARDAAAQIRLSEQLKSLPESLQTSLSISLKQGWLPTSVSVIAARNLGTTVEPEIESHFTVSLQFASDFFVQKESASGVTIVTKVLEEGETRDLTGRGLSTWAEGIWKSVVNLDVEPEIGLPRDSFDGRIIIAGSDEFAAFRAEQKEEEALRHEWEMIRQAALLEEQAAATKVTRARQIEEALKPELTRQVAERVATLDAAATQKRLGELEEALTDKDPKRRRVALDKALKSSDPMVQNMALRDVFSRVKNFSLILERDVQGRTEKGSYILNISEFNRETGDIRTSYGDGRLSGITLGIRETILVSVVGNTMEGSYRDGSGLWKVTVPIQ